MSVVLGFGNILIITLVKHLLKNKLFNSFFFMILFFTSYILLNITLNTIISVSQQIYNIPAEEVLHIFPKVSVFILMAILNTGMPLLTLSIWNFCVKFVEIKVKEKIFPKLVNIYVICISIFKYISGLGLYTMLLMEYDIEIVESLASKLWSYILIPNIFIIMITCFIIIAINIKKLPLPDIKRASKGIVFLAIFFMPLVWLDPFISSNVDGLNFLSTLKNIFPNGLRSEYLFFISLSAACMVLSIKHYFLKSHVKGSITEMFYNDNKITGREKEIVKLLLNGYTNKDIAIELDITYGTVKNHIYNIYQKLEITSRFELIKLVQ